MFESLTKRHNVPVPWLLLVLAVGVILIFTSATRIGASVKNSPLSGNAAVALRRATETPEVTPTELPTITLLPSVTLEPTNTPTPKATDTPTSLPTRTRTATLRPPTNTPKPSATATSASMQAPQCNDAGVTAEETPEPKGMNWVTFTSIAEARTNAVGLSYLRWRPPFQNGEFEWDVYVEGGAVEIFCGKVFAARGVHGVTDPMYSKKYGGTRIIRWQRWFFKITPAGVFTSAN